MGAINYSTSDYITMGIEPYSAYDLENDSNFMDALRDEVNEYGGTIDEALEFYIQTSYKEDKMNIEFILEKYSFDYFHVKIKPGYYEGFTLDIENNFSIAFDGWEDKQAAQKEITSLKKCLLECAETGMVQCSPGWIPAYNDYKGTCKAIGNAIKVMREEVKNTPTWAQYARENARKAG